jgi:2-polyprenyl-6-methoxyphenol hydroxylase-like FAD-dependent oxidoreductase
MASATPFDLRFGARVTDVTQTSDDLVAVRYQDAGGVHTVSAAVCVGADGASSVVRKQLGFAFEGSTYPEMSVIATTDFPFQDHMPDLALVSYCWSASGRFTLLKVPTHWRVSLSPKAGLSLAEATDRELIESQLQAIVPTGKRYEVDSIRGYSGHLRMVEKYRRGRVVLMGDAAHLHSSAGGTGMNGGIHDAFALADCLLQMFRHGASDDVLDRYEAIRRPVTAAEVIPLAKLNRARTHEKDHAAQRKILREMQAITADRAAMKAHLLRTSMIHGVRMSKQAAEG